MAAVHRACPQLFLDVHVATDRPQDIVDALVQAGAGRITFQLENLLFDETNTDPITNTNKNTNTNSNANTNTKTIMRSNGNLNEDEHLREDVDSTCINASESESGRGRGSTNGNSLGGETSTSAVASRKLKVLELARKIRSSGAKCGVCVRPSTPVGALDFLLTAGYSEIDSDIKERKTAAGFDGETADSKISSSLLSSSSSPSSSLPPSSSPLIDLVDILAVNPGFGGQTFDATVLEKVRFLRKNYPTLDYIMVDGGIL